jgi:hypothetical protein
VEAWKMATAQHTDQTSTKTWVALCSVCTTLSVIVLGADLYLPPPWGGLASRQPWAVGGVMALINSCSLLLLAVWLAHLVRWQQLLENLGSTARATWRDFLYWTVGDLRECARRADAVRDVAV